MSDEKAEELIKAVNRLCDLLESVIVADRYGDKLVRTD